MKTEHIILMIAVALSCLFSSCINENESEPDPVFEDFKANSTNWLIFYDAEKKCLKSLQETTALLRQTESLWKAYQDSTRNDVLKKEIVYIKRMASSSIMNSPAFYEKFYNGNSVVERGKGEDEEDITVFYLSDRTIIKASPRVNPEWLGTAVGEKVRKTTGRKLTAKVKEKRYVKAPAEVADLDMTSHWHRLRGVTVTTAFEYVDYVTYQPLYER